MKTLLTAAAFAVAVAPVLPAFAQESGVSTPPPAIITVTPDEAPAPLQSQKPSAAVQYDSAAPTGQPAGQTISSPTANYGQPSGYGPYVPYNPSGPAAAAPRDPDAGIVTSVVAMNRGDRNGDAAIVTYVPSRPNEVPAGTLLRSRIRENLSTAITPAGAPFSAEVTAPMERNGRVIVPVGSIIDGRVTVSRGGKRITGTAAIHLLPESVTLPDGTHYNLHAQVIDTSEHNVTRVNDEGTILRRDHVKGILAAMSLTTGGSAAAGAMIGGVPGALIGGGIGAGVSTVWWLKQDRQEVIPRNTDIIFSLNTPMSISPVTTGTR